jgi:hypothetical protein
MILTRTNCNAPGCTGGFFVLLCSIRRPAMNEEKKMFLSKAFIPLLQKIPAGTPARWGKMNFQQMIEHFSHALKIATGNVQQPRILTGEKQQKAYEFMMSEKPFRENTVNPNLPETPLPPAHHTVQASINELQETLLDFFKTYEGQPGKRVMNPFFGELNYAEQVHLLYKHALHHLKQFGVEPVVKE